MTDRTNPPHDPLLESIVDALIVLHDSPLTVDLQLNGILREAFLRRRRTPPSVEAVVSAPEWAHNLDMLAVIKVCGSHWHHMPPDDWACFLEDC